MRIALPALAALSLLGNSAFALEPDDSIALLSSRSYAEREAGTKALKELGADSLPALQKALAQSTSPEVQVRLAAAIARVQMRADSLLLTKAKPIALDYKDRPLSAAIADFRAKTGIPLVLDPSVKETVRLITVKTDELPPWQALERFCAAAGLQEQLKPDAKQEAKRPGRGGRPRMEDSFIVPPNQALGRPGDLPVVLVDGKGDTPADNSTGVRIRALPMGYPGSGLNADTGEHTLNLDVAPVPGLNWVHTKEIRIGKAMAPSGREVRSVYRSDLLPVSNQNFEGNLGGIQLQVDSIDLVPVLKSNRTNARVLPVAFKIEDVSIKSLKYLEGVIVGEVTRTNRPIITIDELASAKGESFGYRTSSLTVVSLTSDAKSGATTLRLRVSYSTYGQEMLGAQMGGFGGGLRPQEAVLDQRSFANMRYFDAKGAPMKQPVVQGMNSSSDGITNTFEATIRFGSGSDNVPPNPVKLVLTGTEIATVEVPFKLKDVPLE